MSQPPQPNAPGRGAGPARPGPVERGGMYALFLGLLAMVLAIEVMNLMMHAPALSVLAPVAGIAAIVVGVRARRRARSGAKRAPGAVGGIAFGAVGLAFSVLLFASLAVMWPQFSAFRHCTNGANTIAAQNSCNKTFTEDLRKRAGLPPGSLPHLDPADLSG